MKNKILSTMIVLLPFLLIASETFARAGGGGSSGGKSSWLSVIIAPFCIAYGVYVRMKINARKVEVSKHLEKMSLQEPQWTEELLLSSARDIFTETQAAWSSQDLEALKKILHPKLYSSYELQIKAQIALNQKNIMAGLSVNEMRIVSAQNYADDEKDNFTVCFDASASDQTWQNGLMIKTENGAFREFWTFEWEKNKWTLLEVTQAEGWKRFMSTYLVFHKSNNKKAG